jgi:4-aminobutyrate aminotransferase-like enzyme
MKNADKPKTNWAHVDLNKIPSITVPPPGPQSKAWHDRCTKLFKGLSSQVKLFPVTFESGYGCVLTDADGNRNQAAIDLGFTR